MKSTIHRSTAPLHGRLDVPGDKSISHRALLFGALADGESRIDGLLRSGDCMATRRALESLGVSILDTSDDTVLVRGAGLRGLRAASGPVDCGRSGTGMRLLAGILAGQRFASELSGDPQLLARPMRRIVEPLRRMGANIDDTDGRAPLHIAPASLRGMEHRLTVASAQVKSALLLAGLVADGETTVIESGPARDHTERMLAAMGAEIRVEGAAITLRPPQGLKAGAFRVPADISSAAFPLVAALLIPESEVRLAGVGLNPTRTGLLDVLREMGGRIEVEDERTEGGEPVGDLTVYGSSLKGVSIGGDTVVRMIDEFPVLAVAATQASGKTTVSGAAELRVKETDRIGSIVAELTALGAHVDEHPDGFTVHGPTPLRGGEVESYADHRMAMALSVAGLVACDDVTIRQAECADDSYPGFMEQMRGLGVADG